MCFAYIHVFIPHPCSNHGGQKQVWGSSELELETVMSHHRVLGPKSLPERPVIWTTKPSLQPPVVNAFWHRILLCCLGLCSTQSVLEFFIHLPQPLKCVPPCMPSCYALLNILSSPFHIYFLVLHGVEMPQQECGGQRTSCGQSVSTSTVWDLGMGLSSLVDW